MVDIRSIAGSSHPSGRGQGNKQDATSRSRATQSRRANARDATTAVVATAATVHQQHTTVTAAITPPVAGPKGTLGSARALLHNPSGQNASPSAME
jgi:hypothetical protein